MHRPLRGLAAGLLLAAAIVAAVPGGATAQRAAPGSSPFGFGVEFERPDVSLERVLRREQLVVRYSCMSACRPFMRLKVAGVGIAVFNPPGGPTAGSRAAVFELGPASRRAIVAHTHRGVAVFRMDATFTNRSLDRLDRVLRFRLQR